MLTCQCFFGSVTLFLLAFLISSTSGDNFYDILKVDKDAGSKEIRQAFKKLALKMHPDKNMDDPEAHEKFLKINRAHEVLKDEELRNKYDQFGEEGLEENKGWGHYESWRYYQEEFGIYDEDDEIITLSKSDFESSAVNSGDIWFVNFFSPNCGHCHHLAPTWREFAHEIEGVLRIGAVNCGDNWALCRQQGIRSYPSLVLYPTREKYTGDRSKKSLIQFAMSFVMATVHELTAVNFDASVKQHSSKPWLLHLCSAGEDCLSMISLRKLAAIVAKYFEFGSIECSLDPALCNQLGHTSGTIIYEHEKGAVSEAEMSLDPQEIAHGGFSHLPKPKEIEPHMWTNIEEEVNNGKFWLVVFTDDNLEFDLELRKLPCLLKETNVGVVNCVTQRKLCLQLHMKANQVAFYKKGGFEQHHGRLLAEDLAVFARDSSSSHVLALTPSDFPDRIIISRDPWVVDFYAPWCPPCMRLLPEFRKAARSMGNTVSFGTVDCTVHAHLCSKMNIQSYPTTIFYNQSAPHEFHGEHSARSLVEFIEDTLRPIMVTLTGADFLPMVGNRDTDKVWMVDFYAPWCGPCQQLMPVWSKVAKMLKNKAMVAKVDCVANQNLCQNERISSYPTMRLYPSGNTGTGVYDQYTGRRDMNSIQAWAQQYLPSKVEALSWKTFNSEVLDSKSAWLVDFYAPWCGHCVNFAPHYERVAELLDGEVKCGKVNCDEHRSVCSQAQVHSYPTVYFYRGAAGQRQHGVGVKIESQNVNNIVGTVRGFLKERKKSEEYSHDEL